MPPGLHDRVDCQHLADNGAVLERVYPLSEMPRLQDLLADGAAADAEREIYAIEEGRVSLREMAAEELLLALPIVAMHSPQTCGRGPAYGAGGGIQDISDDRSRPFTALQDLLKKT